MLFYLRSTLLHSSLETTDATNTNNGKTTVRKIISNFFYIVIVKMCDDICRSKIKKTNQRVAPGHDFKQIYLC